MELKPTRKSPALRTYLYFAGTDASKTFMQDYSQILIDNFQNLRIENGGEYWTCGQNHDPRNWNWKPWYHLERLSRKRGLYDFAVRDIPFEHLGRNLECECQVLYDEREFGRMPLTSQFGVDFESGEVGLVD
jgi:hypothetical protein